MSVEQKTVSVVQETVSLERKTVRLERKTVLIGMLLAAFTLWPLAHRVVVERYLISPWRLFGWAMYCVPVYHPEVRFFSVAAGVATEIDFSRQSRDDDAAYRRFLAYRRELGTLIETDEVARIAFRQNPQVDRLVVQVKHRVYHPESSGLREVRFEDSFERRQSASPR